MLSNKIQKTKYFNTNVIITTNSDALLLRYVQYYRILLEYNSLLYYMTHTCNRCDATLITTQANGMTEV